MGRMTTEQIRNYIEANEDIKKMLHRFMRHNDNIITSSLSDAEENKLHAIFMNAYKTEVKKLWDKVMSDNNRLAFETYLSEEGITDFLPAKEWADENSNDIKNNPLADPSITKAQREGLEAFHRWLNRNCEKKGILGDDKAESGGMRDFANRFMSQPASVQLKALYLLETGKRKNPDEVGFDDFNSQMDYVPSLDKIKKPLIASPLKIWKRTNGSHFYWNKLNQSLKIAEKSAGKLEDFRKDLRRDVEIQPGEDNIEKHSKLNTLTSIDKLIGSNKYNVIAGFKEQANIISNSQTDKDVKEQQASDVLGDYKSILPEFQYNTENTKTIKGSWEVGKDIIDQKENYQNVERIFKAYLASCNERHELGNPPPKGIIAYINDDKSYLKDLPSNLFDGLNLAGDVTNLISGFADYLKNFHNINLMQKFTGVLNMGASASDGVYRVTQMLMSAANTGAVSWLKDGYDTFKDWSGAAGAITGTLAVGKNAATIVKQGLNRYAATNAKIYAEGSRLSPDEKKRVNDIADFSHTKSVRTQRSAIRGMIKGVGSLATSAGATAIAAVPCAGPILLVGVTGMSAYEQYKGRKNRHELARLAVDKLVTGSEKIEEKLTTHSERLKTRADRYVKGDKTREKIIKFREKQNKVKDRTRNEEAVKAGHTSLFTCTAGATNAVADELLKKTFLIKPEKGFVKGNIITDSKEHVYHRIERSSYKELLESMGVEVKYKSKKEVADAKKFEKRLQEKKAAQLGS